MVEVQSDAEEEKKQPILTEKKTATQEEEESDPFLQKEFVLNREPVFCRHHVGDME